MRHNSIQSACANGIGRRRFVQGLGGAGIAGIAGCLGGDGASGANLQGDIRVAGWSATDDGMGKKIQSLLDSYEQDHSGVTAEYTSVQSKYKQKLKTQLGAGEAPDVFWLDSSYSPAFGGSSATLDLTSLVEEEGYMDDMFDVLVDAFNIDGKQYGVPKDFNTLGMYFHEGLFEEAGVSETPTTWSDLQSTLQAIKDQTDVDAPMTIMPNGRIWWAMVYQNGGRILSEDGSECVCASDANVEALQFLVDLADDDLALRPNQIGTSWPGQTLEVGKTAVTSMGAWGISYLEQNAPEVDEKVDVAHLPHPESGEKATTAYVVSYSGASSTDSEQATKGIIKLLTKPESALEFATNTGGGGVLSPYQSHQDTEFYQNHERRKTMLEAAEWAHVWQYGPNSEGVFNRLNPELEGALLGNKSPRDALETAQQKINSEILSG